MPSPKPSSPSSVLDYAHRRNPWRDALRVVVPVLMHVMAALGGVLAIFVCLLTWVEWHGRPRPVAAVAYPDGSSAVVLWWGHRGDLEGDDGRGDRFLIQRDYYQSRTVAATRWTSAGELELDMSDGVRITIDLSARSGRLGQVQTGR